MPGRPFIVSTLAFLVTFAPKLAQACAVCMTGREDDTTIAFELSTAFLTVTPLLMLGCVLWRLRKRLRELEEVHEAARSESPPASVPQRPVVSALRLEH